MSYGILRFIYNQRDANTTVALQSEPEFGFNYLGNFDVMFSDTNNLFSRATEKMSSGSDLCAKIPYKLSMACYIENNKIHANWVFSSNLYAKRTIDRLSCTFRDNVMRLLDAN